ncbi:MAG: response regulator [bacterium]
MTRSTIDSTVACDRALPVRILVVDDEAGVRRAVARSLTAVGYDVTCAQSGEEALQVAADASPSFDLVISDIMMPGMSGVDLVERLQQADDRLRVMLISGYPGSHLAEVARSKGNFDLLEKPFSPAQLTARVNERIAPSRGR